MNKRTLLLQGLVWWVYGLDEEMKRRLSLKDKPKGEKNNDK